MSRECNPLHKGWTLVHTRILKLALSGETGSAIARKIGKNHKYVYALCRTPLYQKKYEYHKKSAIEKVQQIFEDGAVSAAKTIKHIERKGKPEDRVRLDAAKDIIDRIGYKPVQVIETRQRAYTPQEIESAKSTVKELEDTLVRLERKDSVYVLKRKISNVTQPPIIEDAGEPVSEPSSDRPETVSA